MCKNRAEAKQRIKNFLTDNCGKNVLFWVLDETGKYDYILVKQYNYFAKFLRSPEALTRAIKNANSHYNSGYGIFAENPNEHMIIS